MFYMWAPAQKTNQTTTFLTAWRSAGLDSNSVLYVFHCTCAVTVSAVQMGRAVLLALAHLGEPYYPLKGVHAAG